MRWVVAVLATANAGFGVRWLLEAVGVLQSGKYASGTSAIAGVLALGVAAGALWLAFRAGKPAIALALAAGPWAIGAIVVLVALITSPRQ